MKRFTLHEIILIAAVGAAGLTLLAAAGGGARSDARSAACLDTLKKYGGRDPETGKAVLQYCNRAVYADRRVLVKDLVCQGIVSHVIKAF